MPIEAKPPKVPQKPLYDSLPHVPEAKLANTAREQTASLGNEQLKMVPKVAHNFPQAGSGAHGYGHGVGARSGHTRLSGHPKAHKIGKR